jgi:putative DNA primase/helicase
VAWFWHDGGRDGLAFWRWNGRVYAKVPETELVTEVQDFLDAARKRSGEEGTVRFRPAPADISKLIACLKGGLTLKGSAVSPMWLGSGEPAGSLMAFRNAIVDLRSGVAVEPSPNLWIHAAVDFDWVPDAECPVWDKFLEDIFPGDRESWQCLEEFGGLCIALDQHGPRPLPKRGWGPPKPPTRLMTPAVQQRRSVIGGAVLSCPAFS